VIDVRAARGDDDLDAALALRHTVFVGEQGVPEAEDVDGRDGEAMHFVALDDGRVVGTCRLLAAGDRVRLGRLAVDRDRRRRGVASALLARAELWARERGAHEIVLAAQTDARALYEQTGYVARGEVFVEAGIEHVMMDKPLV
jgi:predicted GNAT family N-acyltransferase